MRVWDAETGEPLRQLEGHTGYVQSVSWSADGDAVISKSEDGSLRVWRADTWDFVAAVDGSGLGQSEDMFGRLPSAGALHPTEARLATAGTRPSERIRVLDLDFDLLLGGRGSPAPGLSRQYTNAKVVVVGDQSVGKTGLARALMGEEFIATESTHGRHVWTLDAGDVELDGGHTETRETLLWDLAGQPGYRLTHQLYLDDVSLALVVMDARSETQPFAGVRHWARALRQAKGGVATEKLLVVARTDVGDVAVSPEDLDAVVDELGFGGRHETSAKERWGIDELAEAIREAIDWDARPKVTTTELFRRIQRFIVDRKEAEHVLSTADDLYAAFHAAEESEEDVRAAFDTCLGRGEALDLIRQLPFGDLVLLQPEYIDAYASAIVNEARSARGGQGQIREEAARNGDFQLAKGERLSDKKQERLLLAATVDDLLAHEIALREHTDEGDYLVFPSEFTRDRDDLPDPPGKAVTFTFEGALLNVYCTLAVRLAHSGQFSAPEMWRRAATFAPSHGGRCGMFLRELQEGRGELTLFFETGAHDWARYQFEEYIRKHLDARAAPDTLTERRHFVCEECAEPVADTTVARRRARGHRSMSCGVCDAPVSLLLPDERMETRPDSTVEKMDRVADARKAQEQAIGDALGEMETESFREWAGAEATTLGIVFTDIVGSTRMGLELGDDEMRDKRGRHLGWCDTLIERHGGRLLRSKGDGVIAVFHVVTEAADLAVAAHGDPGDHDLSVRVGVHVGPVSVGDGDMDGNAIGYAARVEAQASAGGVWISDSVKRDLDTRRLPRHCGLPWVEHEAVELKDFPGEHTLWALGAPSGDDTRAGTALRSGRRRVALPEHPKVFVSSTYTDLVEHRTAVARQIQRRDMLFRGMEDFGSHPTLSPSELVAQEVEAAHVYVGVFGVRYGSLDPATGLSMTELEYRTASEADKPMLIYVMHDEALVPAGDRDADPELVGKLSVFKEGILANRMVHLFRSVEELARQVYTDLGELLTGG